MPSHKSPTYSSSLSHRRRHSAHLRILHTSSSFFFLRPSTHHGPTADRPSVRPTDPSVRPRHQSSHHHHRTRSRLTRSLARSMPTHTRRRSTAHARALLPDLRSFALARSLARLSHSLHYLLAEPAASLRRRVARSEGARRSKARRGEKEDRWKGRARERVHNARALVYRVRIRRYYRSIRTVHTHARVYTCAYAHTQSAAFAKCSVHYI